MKRNIDKDRISKNAWKDRQIAAGRRQISLWTSLPQAEVVAAVREIEGRKAGLVEPEKSTTVELEKSTTVELEKSTTVELEKSTTVVLEKSTTVVLEKGSTGEPPSAFQPPRTRGEAVELLTALEKLFGRATEKEERGKLAKSISRVRMMLVTLPEKVQ